jgi:hypothetical protein
MLSGAERAHETRKLSSATSILDEVAGEGLTNGIERAGLLLRRRASHRDGVLGG